MQKLHVKFHFNGSSGLITSFTLKITAVYLRKLFPFIHLENHVLIIVIPNGGSLMYSHAATLQCE